MSKADVIEETKVVESVEDGIPLEEVFKKMKMTNVNEEKALEPMFKEGFADSTDKVSDETRFASSLAALVWNIDVNNNERLDRGKIQELVSRIDEMVNDQINEVIHHEKFQKLESTWRGVYDIIENANFRKNVMINLLDVSKDELGEDFENNAVDFTNSALFKKLYDQEFDQFGGKPFGSIVGLYEFENIPADLRWLRIMGKIATANHAPFIGSVSTRFFDCDNIEELANVNDLEGLMNQPKYSGFNALRDSEEAAYIGLCLPSYVLRQPWDPVKNPCKTLNFKEYTWGDDNSKYLWGNGATLFAKNMIRSFENSGWCQYLTGPKGGGMVKGLPVHTFNLRGEEEIKVPVEMAIPGYRELEFANCGFIPLVYKKGTGDACYFSSQSLKRPKKFKDPKDSENAQLVCDLAYTFSITRIAHYVQQIIRENLGSSADENYMQKILSNWINDYVTETTNPDDRTLMYYPFKAARIAVTPQEGKVGWYDCTIEVKPHYKLQGMDVELRLESRL